MLFTTFDEANFGNLSIQSNMCFEGPQLLSSGLAKSKLISSLGFVSSGNLCVFAEPKMNFKLLPSFRRWEQFFPWLQVSLFRCSHQIFSAKAFAPNCPGCVSCNKLINWDLRAAGTINLLSLISNPSSNVCLFGMF